MESLGARLKRERERQKMSLDDVATATKIGTRMLKALEEDHFDQLPGGIFNKGFVRAYARQLGMDEEQAVSDYLSATSPAQAVKEPEAVLSALAVRAEKSRAAERPGGGELPWDKLAAVLLLVAFGFALWGWRSRKQNHAEAGQPFHPPSPVSAPPAVTSSPAAVPAVPAPPADAPSSPGAPSSSPAAVPAPAAQSPAAQSPAPVAESGSFLLLIQAHDDSWIDISADGKEIAHQLLPAGAQKSVQAGREIIVKAGNVGGLDFTLNGKKLPSQQSPDRVKTLRFNATGLQPPVADVQKPTA